jgi:hypothetical protein
VAKSTPKKPTKKAAPGKAAKPKPKTKKSTKATSKPTTHLRVTQPPPAPVSQDPPGYRLIAGLTSSDVRIVTSPPSEADFVQMVGPSRRLKVAAPIALAEVIKCGGIDGLNDLADAALLPTDAPLGMDDIVYRLVGMSVDGLHLLIEVSADVSAVLETMPLQAATIDTDDGDEDGVEPRDEDTVLLVTRPDEPTVPVVEEKPPF